MVSGVRQSEHITPVLEDLHWLLVSQPVVCKTALMVCVPAAAISGRQHLRSVATGTLRDGNWTTKFRSQRTSHMEPSATSTATSLMLRVCRRLSAAMSFVWADITLPTPTNHQLNTGTTQICHQSFLILILQSWLETLTAIIQTGDIRS